MPLILTAVICYLLGSITWGLVLARAAGFGDIRHIGSGSTGATNVLRTGNKTLAALTLALDLGKGVVAALIGSLWGPTDTLVASGAVIVGHMFPIWLAFRGGKGVATAFGVLLVIAWPLALAAAVLWLLTAAISRYSSLASLCAAITSAALAGFMVDYGRAWLIGGIALLIILRHQENIRRLVAGTESHIKFSGT